jgi:hypothetical protein
MFSDECIMLFSIHFEGICYCNDDHVLIKMKLWSHALLMYLCFKSHFLFNGALVTTYAVTSA